MLVSGRRHSGARSSWWPGSRAPLPS